MLGIAGGDEWKKDGSGQLEPRGIVGARLREGRFGGVDDCGGKFRVGGVNNGVLHDKKESSLCETSNYRYAGVAKLPPQFVPRSFSQNMHDISKQMEADLADKFGPDLVENVLFKKKSTQSMETQETHVSSPGKKKFAQSRKDSS